MSDKQVRIRPQCAHQEPVVHSEPRIAFQGIKESERPSVVCFVCSIVLVSVGSHNGAVAAHSPVLVADGEPHSLGPRCVGALCVEVNERRLQLRARIKVRKYSYHQTTDI